MFKTGTANNGTSGKASSPIQTILQKIQSVNTHSMQKSEDDATKFSFFKDSIDKKTEKKYNETKKKRTSYNENETLFMQWQHGNSASVGDTKAFIRLDKKIHFYEKTEDGCIEITQKDFDKKRVFEHERDYESIERRIDVLSHKYGTVAKRRDNKFNDVYGYAGYDSGNDISTEREEFQNEQSGNLERSGADGEESSEIKFSLQETGRASETRKQLIKDNDKRDRFNYLVFANVQKIQVNRTTNREWNCSESATYLSKLNPQLYSDKLKQFLMQMKY